MLGSIGTLAIVIGFVISYLAGVLCQWNLLALIGGVFPALLVIFLYFMPETPLWLLSKKQRTEALASLVWLRGSDGHTEEECLNVESTIGTRVLFFKQVEVPTRLRVVPHFSSGIVERGGDFHPRSRFARTTITEEKWGTTRGLSTEAQAISCSQFLRLD